MQLYGQSAIHVNFFFFLICCVCVLFHVEVAGQTWLGVQQIVQHGGIYLTETAWLLKLSSLFQCGPSCNVECSTSFREVLELCSKRRLNRRENHHWWLRVAELSSAIPQFFCFPGPPWDVVLAMAVVIKERKGEAAPRAGTVGGCVCFSFLFGNEICCFSE